MHKDDCFELGHVTKLHGYKGAVKFFLDTDSPESYKKLESILLEVSGNLTPFFIQQINIKNNLATITFEGVNTEEMARSLIKTKGYLPLNQLPKLDNKHFYFHEIVGFTCVDRTLGELGKISEVFDLSSNVLLQVIYKEQEILLPTNEGVDLVVDRAKKTITLTSPPGLIDTYIHG